ncbi:MAG: hypothetical protein PF570_04225 [Candidatus Cloacimonetes bacterium]|jgi:hypothetical protein|nr:hypothetical protein [Candidatus Cloacimonadota bacterium]
MKKKAFMFMLFLVISLSLGAIDWNISGAGARAAGMGGAFIGVADDATAITWNPAGLTQLYRPEVSLVARFIAENYKYESTSFDGSVDNQSHFIVNFASAAYPIMDGRIVAAIAFQKQLDWYSGWESDEDETADGGANTIIPGIAIRILPILSAGFSTNIWIGNSVKDTYDGDYVERTISFSGFNMAFGLMADFDNLQNPVPLKIGMMMRTPFELGVEVDADYENYSDLHYKNTVDMPMMIGFGASYRIGDNLTISSDYEIRAYGKSKINYEFSPDNPANLSESGENLNQIRVGAEYLIVSDFAVIPFRFGYKTIPTLQANGEGPSDNWEYTDQVIGNGFSFGTGLIFEKIAIDATGELTTTKEEWDNWPDYNENESGTKTKFRATLSCVFYF